MKGKIMNERTRQEKAKKIFDTLRKRFADILRKQGWEDSEIVITAKTLTPEEAIGTPGRRDFPIQTGKEVMLDAEFRGAHGQAFTDSPADFRGTIREILSSDSGDDLHAMGLFIATMNAVMCYLGDVDGTVHCKNEGPELCAAKMEDALRERYHPRRITLVGYQPAMLERLSEHFEVRVLDLNPANIGQVRYGVMVEDGAGNTDEVLNEWPDLVLCTGSTICNGTLVDFLDLKKKTVFYGTTIAAAAPVLGLERLCFASETEDTDGERK